MGIEFRLVYIEADLNYFLIFSAYPMGLPEWDTIRLTLQGNEGIEGTAAGVELLDPETAELWVASRMFDRSQTIAERLGRNDKTKVVGKLQKPGTVRPQDPLIKYRDINISPQIGAGPPGREPAVNEEEKKAM